MHSFCRTCIIKYFSTYFLPSHHEWTTALLKCPICNVELGCCTASSINTVFKVDKILQAIIYKLVPHLFHNEMLARRKFYDENANNCAEEIFHLSPEKRGHPLTHLSRLGLMTSCGCKENIGCVLLFYSSSLLLIVHIN